MERCVQRRCEMVLIVSKFKTHIYPSDGYHQRQGRDWRNAIEGTGKVIECACAPQKRRIAEGRRQNREPWTSETIIPVLRSQNKKLGQLNSPVATRHPALYINPPLRSDVPAAAGPIDPAPETDCVVHQAGPEDHHSLRDNALLSTAMCAGPE